MESIESYSKEALDLLKKLIEIPSFSKEENKTGDLLEEFFHSQSIETKRFGNNVIALPKEFNPDKSTVWLNSHHDTVKPNKGYTLDPFKAKIEDGKLYGLGSNDAGGCLVSLIATFCFFYDKEVPVNSFLIASAEEEISGKNGISSIIQELPECELAIVGEPTLNEAAVAEKGLMVIDAKVRGRAGHAARDEGVNALYEALDDLNKIREFEFTRKSEFLGKSKVSATIIQSGTQHNVVPDRCNYTLDVRVTDAYNLSEALEELKKNLSAELTPRSMRLQSSKLPNNHPIQGVLDKMRIKKYGSPTLSDQALIPFPSLKMGPGDSSRSHSANEFIYVHEIEGGIRNYIQLLENYFHEKLQK